MISFNVHPKGLQHVLLTVTAICLFVGSQGAVAGNSGEHGGRSGHEFGGHNERMMSHESQGDRGRGGDHRAGNNTMRPTVSSERHRNRDKHGDKSHAHASTKNSVECIKAPCSIGGADRHVKHAGDGNKGKAAGTSIGSTPPAAPGTAGNNTIHPIVTKGPGQPTANAGTGKLPPNDPVGHTHPTPGANPPTVVTVSNGVTTTQIQNGPGGVAVYSDKPGTITITNGKESTTLSGGSMTLSGNVVGVGHGDGIEVGPRNGEGKTVVAIRPPAPAPAAPSHVTGGPEGGFFGALGSSIKDGAKAVGNGLENGAVVVGKGISDGLGIDTSFKAGPSKIVPPPVTSTIQQQ